jgi:hypothetical protein
MDLMKNISKYFIIILLFALSPSLYSQRFLGEVVGGMNLSQVDGDEVIGYKQVGGYIGLGAILPIKKKWDITLETVFSQKGAHEGPQYTDSLYGTVVNGAYDLRLNYVEVPLTAHFTDRERYTVGAGFAYGRLVSSEEIEHDGAIPPYSDTVAFSKNDFTVLADLQIRIWKGLKFGFRYSYSMAPIRERTFIDPYGISAPNVRKQYNNALTFRLVYVINEKFTPKPVTSD